MAIGTGTTPYEREYDSKVNTYGLIFLAIHLPVLCGLALWNHGSLGLTAGVMVLLLSGPLALLARDRSSHLGSVAIAIAAMGVSALTIHLAGGMIEAHFELFVLIGMLAVFGRMAPLLAAGATIALHHVVFWLWLPTSVFNYKASFGIVLVHAFFVVLEVVPSCWVARQLGRSIRAQGIVLARLGEAAEQISVAANELAAASQGIAEGASRQVASIEETSAAMVEINSLARRTNDTSKMTTEAVEGTTARFESAREMLAEMIQAMEGIKTSSSEISRIIKTIDQIAFQTNILALNAAVEAARAGESGMGFAVVADEVRSLARRSAEAAQETAQLVEDSIARSRQGSEKVSQVAAEIQAITGQSSEILRLMGEINLGSQEQAKGIDQVSKSIFAMEEVTQSNAAAAEQASATSQELTVHSKAVMDIFRMFTAAGEGAAA